MRSAIKLWNDIYFGRAPWLSSGVRSLGLAAAISSELARLVTLEMSFSVSGGKRAKCISDAMSGTLKDIRRTVEYACAGGGAVFKPCLYQGGITVDTVRAENFYPTACDEHGKITSAIFVSRITRGKKIYTLLEEQTLSAEGVKITNTAYVSDNVYSLGAKTPLTSIPEWEHRAPSVNISGVKKPLFAYFKMPLANNFDPDSPLGVSVFSRAVELIERADRHFASIVWEYEGSELAIDASIDLFSKNDRGDPILPRGKERLFRAFDIDSMREGAFLKEFSPEIRDVSLFNGLDRIFKRIEFNCGLSYGSISDPSTVEMSATEIIASKQRLYSTVSDIQKALEFSLRELAEAINTLASAAKLSSDGEYELAFKWDDSIIIDAASEQKIRLEEVNSGILAPEEYLSWRYAIPKEKAVGLMPGKDV